MASFSAGTTFTDGVANDVTAAKLGALVNNATPTSGLIQDRTAETVVATNDTFLIGDASDSNTLKRMTVANVMKAEHTGTINTTAGTITTLNSTTGTITTGVIPTLTSITKITSGTGTAAAPAISPTGDTNTGIFFPAADTIAFAEGGTEGMRIDSSGNVGIGTNSPATYMSAYSGSANGIVIADSGIPSIIFADTASTTYSVVSQNGTSLDLFNNAAGSTNFYTNGTERLRIDSSGNVGIGRSPSYALDVYKSGATTSRISALNDNVVTTLEANGSTTGYSGTLSNHPFGIITNNTERLRIDSDGDVSIGTATALSKLHVHGNITLSNTTTATSAGTGGLTLPASAAGYLTVSINGTSRKIPYYAT